MNAREFLQELLNMFDENKNDVDSSDDTSFGWNFFTEDEAKAYCLYQTGLDAEVFIITIQEARVEPK